MSKLEDILSSANENSWTNLTDYAEELNTKYCRLVENSAQPDNETIEDIKKLLYYADGINDKQKLQILHAMIDCIDYFDIKQLRFLLSYSKTMDSWDYEIIKSRLLTFDLEERDREEKRISNISYNRNQIIQYIYNHYYDLSVPKDWYNNHWEQLCGYLNSAFNMNMSGYKTGNQYAIPVYDAATIITYGIMLFDEKNRHSTFLQNVKSNNYESINVTEWKTFWNLEFSFIRKLLSKDIKYDVKGNGTCSNSKILCNECPNLFSCSHCSSIYKTINSTELTVNGLLKIRDNILKSASASKEMVQRFASFLITASLNIKNSNHKNILYIYLYTLYQYLPDIMQRIIEVRNNNENYAFLNNDDFDIDYEKQIIHIPFEMPQINIAPSIPNTTDSNSLTQSINDRIDNYFSAMKYECYRCMMICPSKSPLAKPLEQTNMLSQQADLFKLSLKKAIEILKRNFKEGINDL